MSSYHDDVQKLKNKETFKAHVQNVGGSGTFGLSESEAKFYVESYNNDLLKKK